MNNGTDKIVQVRAVRDLGGLLNATFMFIRHEFSSFFPAILFIAGPFFIAGGIFIGFYFEEVFSNMGSFGSVSATRIADPFGMMFNSLVSAALNLFGVLALMAVVLGYFKLYIYEERTKIPLNEVFQSVLKQVLPLLGYNLLLGLLFAGAYLIILLPAVISPFITLALILLSIIPFIYFIVSLILGPQALIFEKRSIFDAMKRSFQLVKGYWWPTLGYSIVTYLIAATLSGIFFLPLYIQIMLTGIFSIDVMAEPSTFDSILRTLFGILAALGSLFTAIFYIMFTFHFFNLVERKEAPTLMNRLDEMESEMDKGNE